MKNKSKVKSQKSKFNWQRGVSLLETLLYVAMLSLIMFTVVIFLTLMINGRTKNQSVSEVEQQGTVALAVMTQYIRNAASIKSVSATSMTIVAPSGINQTFKLRGTSLNFNNGTTDVDLTNNHVAVAAIGGNIFQDLSRSNTDGTIQITFTLSYNASLSNKKSEFTYTRNFEGLASLR